jgi:hypothetical protein
MPSLGRLGRVQRLPLLLRLFAKLPDSKGTQGSRPWSGVVLTERL